MKSVSNKETVRNVITKEELISALRKIGVSSNQIIEVHSSLSSFGYLVGGARTIVDALLEIAESTGTILMPTQTPDNTDPSNWVNPPLIPELWKKVREHMPPYDAKKTDMSGMGEVVENFRHREGIECSNHPTVSYAAWGRYAKLLCNRQSLHFPLSEESPAARLYELNGYVLLLGTDLTTCTCMHLAEYRSDCRPIVIEGTNMIEKGQTTWKKFLNLAIDSDDFNQVLPNLRKKGLVHEIDLGSCHIMFFPARAAIDEATNFFDKTIVYDLYR